jgi:hypothetical protein
VRSEGEGLLTFCSDFCADELAATLLRPGDELLTLARAAQESGYTATTFPAWSNRVELPTRAQVKAPNPARQLPKKH